jgi:hypothetical protein
MPKYILLVEEIDPPLIVPVTVGLVGLIQDSQVIAVVGLVAKVDTVR